MKTLNFRWGSLAPDTHLEVFGHVFNVHSVALQAHSEFFRAFLDPEKAPHRYGSKVDQDGTWGLQPLNTIDKDEQAAVSHAVDTQLETSAFRLFLKALYGQPYNIDSTKPLQALVRLADFYGALRAVRISVQYNILRKSDASKYFSTCCYRILEVATILRSPSLFREAFVHAVGQWNPDLPNFHAYLEPNLRTLITRHHSLNCMKLPTVLWYLLCMASGDSVDNEFDPHDSEILREALADGFYDFCDSDECIEKSAKAISLWEKAPFFRSIYNYQFEGGRNRTIGHKNTAEKVDKLLRPLMRNNLTFHAREDEVLEYPYFLFVEISDEDLPWNAAVGKVTTGNTAEDSFADHNALIEGGVESE
ncbi:MAG: hypothetical protein M1837_007134 [Sclerophora amabilis]|nr:MAG: hypothetical protein M1837_007134 [Sclerophora amabilis]